MCFHMKSVRKPQVTGEQPAADPRPLLNIHPVNIMLKSNLNVTLTVQEDVNYHKLPCAKRCFIHDRWNYGPRNARSLKNNFMHFKLGTNLIKV